MIEKDDFIYNIVYRKGMYDFESKKELYPDSLLIFTKNSITKDVKFHKIDQPEFEFYTTKDEFKANYTYPRMSAPLDELDKHVCKYKFKEKELARVLGYEKEFKEAKNIGYDVWKDFMNKVIYPNPHLYNGDMKVETYYKFLDYGKYGSKDVPVFDKAYFDIETDISRGDGDIYNPQAPINLITLYLEKTNELFAFILNEEGLVYKEQLNSIRDKEEEYKKNYLYDDYKDNPNLKIKFLYYDTERELVYDFFKKVQDEKPQFILAFNSNFDITFLMNRSRGYLDLDPNLLFTHSDVPREYRTINYKIDRARNKGNGSGGPRKQKEFQTYWDYMEAPSYTVWLDSMSMYANLRNKREPSYSLAALSDKVCIPYYKKQYEEKKKEGLTGDDLEKYDVDVTKLNLRDYGITKFEDACNINFPIFLKYGLKDTYVLFRMETIEGDLDKIILECGDLTTIQNPTAITIVLRDMLTTFLWDNSRKEIVGQIVRTPDNLGPLIPNEGGLCSSPAKSIVKSIKLNGLDTKIHNYIVDCDASSMYPSLIRTYNMGRDTIYGTILSVKDSTGKELCDGKDFARDFQTRDQSIFNIARIFGMRSLIDYIKELEKI